MVCDVVLVVSIRQLQPFTSIHHLKTNNFCITPNILFTLLNGKVDITIKDQSNQLDFVPVILCETNKLCTNIVPP